MKQQIILTLVVIAVTAFLGGYGLGSLNDNSNSLTTSEIINVSSESSAVDVDTLTIGFIPVEKADELTPKAKALETFLENELGIDVKIVVPTDYEAIIEGMRFGHIDAAFMDTGPAWITHQRTGAEAVMAELVEGKVNYQATVWTLADNDSIHSLADTVGKRVAFTSITGSSGFVRPMGTLVTEGYVTIEGDDIVALESALAHNFESYTFAGGYKSALELLLNGNVDAAFGSDVAPQKYLELGDQVKLRPAATIGPVPSHVFMVNSDMSESTRDALVDALIKLNYDENNHILKDLYGAEALVPTTTTMHIGEFGDYIDALTGLDQLILDSYNKSK
ncbi:MAG: phosphate/phosphite/phosphonate ABC transporter substrate-binding protein [Nitrosopumilus sp.]|nr:phosphate/phosphite/phosphonate ABC transporter substrate-binding protein [Nitrosopumilus sp.]MDF2423142.1 phosphate/phosphite/phosphonate ABC transporter substrate-binding protein [Nitrosopumilus sp.]MDF2424144.1 phosphate/phosphite/phosphonate ABC transporter substrate-binding protein [Nitrosopumilus sp.]MDF2425983.1 phosphate/phosphite/phosphonate ABC transporter substrate-binding protein [Nitrosopumilus sp.]MDF2427547.1 phosphate/phosphite/phosphonate ABC transporter substrate-binding pr